MTALRKAIRQIRDDLIAKRLWPVALALLAALAVVPMLLGGSSSPPVAPAPLAAAPPPASDPAAPVADDDGPAPAPAVAGRDRASGGAVRDPFYDPPSQPAAASAMASAGPPGGATRAIAEPATPSNPSNPSKPSKPSASSGAATGAASAKKPAGAKRATPASSTAQKPRPAPLTAPGPTRPEAVRRHSYYRAVARWGPTRNAAPHTIARLTPLGGRRNPAALYLGVTKPGATYAIFVLGRHAVSRGDGTCRAETQCRMIALRPGDTRWFEVRSPADGSMRRYTLRLSSLTSVQTTASAARRGRIRVHPEGRGVLRAMWGSPGLAEVLAWASYDRFAGLLRPAAAGADLEKPAR